MEYARHIHVLEYLAKIPRTEEVPNQPIWAVKRPAIATPELAMQWWDELFTFIHENWAYPSGEDCRYYAWKDEIPESVKVNIFDCGQALKMPATEIEERLKQLPPYFSEVIFPVAVGRFMLRELDLPFNPRNSVTFREFFHRYGALVLNC